MRKLLLLILTVFASISFGQQQISGYVIDGASGESLIGAIIKEVNTGNGTTTNAYGFYSLQVSSENAQIEFSYIGYQTQVKELNTTIDKEFTVELFAEDYTLNEAVISYTEQDRKIENAEMSVNTISSETIKKIPVVLGEVDLVKSIQLLPGVTSNGEASNGFNVRGGSEDQNLVLLDEAIIYNSAHVLGFFSVFNNDAIKDVKLYKGGIPAQFGGRISSVLDVRQKDGNNKQFHTTGGVGLISSRLMVEGPLQKEKSSYLLAGRTSYVGLFLKLADNPNRLNFYDLNTKVNWDFNDKNKLYLSGYFGNDLFALSDFFSNSYGNETANIRWNHVFNQRLFSNLSAIYSRYRYNLDFKALDFEWDSGIKNLNIKYDFDYYINNSIDLKFGANAIGYDFNPGEIIPTTDDSSINYAQLQQKRALETGLYVEANHDLTDALTAQYGLRFSNFNRYGGQSINTYQSTPVLYDEQLDIYKSAEPIGSTSYTKSERLERFNNFEPRVSLAYQIGESNSVKASYNRTVQYLHLITNTTSPTPFDVWAPSGPFIEPQIGNQVAIGYFQNIANQAYTAELEGYYKTVKNKIDYIDGADLIGNDAIEQDILHGQSQAYGAELLLQKNKGPLTGWLAYTYSKAEQQTPGGEIGGLGINNGNWYAANYDRTHDVSLTASYELNKKWQFSSNFIVQSGRPITFPQGKYEYQGLTVADYAPRNSYRLPAYHRLDLAATLTPRNNENKKIKSEWVFGVYNAYDRRNANSITFRDNVDTGETEAVKLSIFGIVPSISWNFKY